MRMRNPLIVLAVSPPGSRRAYAEGFGPQGLRSSTDTETDERFPVKVLRRARDGCVPAQITTKSVKVSTRPGVTAAN